MPALFGERCPSRTARSISPTLFASSAGTILDGTTSSSTAPRPRWCSARFLSVSDPVAGTLASLGVYRSVSIRPLGGLLFGPLGDNRPQAGPARDADADRHRNDVDRPVAHLCVRRHLGPGRSVCSGWRRGSARAPNMPARSRCRPRFDQAARARQQHPGGVGRRRDAGGDRQLRAVYAVARERPPELGLAFPVPARNAALLIGAFRQSRAGSPDSWPKSASVEPSPLKALFRTEKKTLLLAIGVDLAPALSYIYRSSRSPT